MWYPYDCNRCRNTVLMRVDIKDITRCPICEHPTLIRSGDPVDLMVVGKAPEKERHAAKPAPEQRRTPAVHSTSPRGKCRFCGKAMDNRGIPTHERSCERKSLRAAIVDTPKEVAKEAAPVPPADKSFRNATPIDESSIDAEINRVEAARREAVNSASGRGKGAKRAFNKPPIHCPCCDKDIDVRGFTTHYAFCKLKHPKAPAQAAGAAAGTP